MPEVGMTRTVSIPSLLAEMKRERVDILKLDIESRVRRALGLGVMEWSCGWTCSSSFTDRIASGLHGRLYEGVGGDEAISKKGDKNMAVRVAA